MAQADPLIAVFIDFENLALGVRDAKTGDFQIQLILKKLLEKGRIVHKRAYCDWSRYRSSVREFHGEGIEMIDIPQSRMSGKNSADIRMVVDAIDLCYSKSHIDIFALISGDSDFSPLVSKLKENNKRVIGCGVKNSTSGLLVSSCDEFIYYDDLVAAVEKKVAKAKAKAPATRSSKKAAPKNDLAQEGLDILLEIVSSLESDYDPVWGSLVKQTLHRVHPGFREGHHGFDSFTAMLTEGQKRGLLDLEFDETRGNYKVHTKG
ncbi:MAG: hypothetical protein ACI8TX_001144 [Hyphomicrobiaceae bacterium]|jgi:hypothetical protein